MDIIRPDKHTFSLVDCFLEQYEEKCVLLCSHVRRRDEKVFAIIDEGKILGVLYIGSTLFHCIPKESLPFLNGDFMLAAISRAMNGKKIKCISGESTTTDFFINLFKTSSINAFQINRYKLMTISELSYQPSAFSMGEEIIRCTVNDLDQLFNIQKKYLQDEVAPKGKKVSDLEVSMTLKQILKNQLCLSVFCDGEAVAKANTNAIGINWVQIGGVYTNPLYRRNGYALQLVCTICKRALKVNKKVALFVKEKNISAIELYKKLNFQEKDSYTIAYF